MFSPRAAAFFAALAVVLFTSVVDGNSIMDEFIITPGSALIELTPETYDAAVAENENLLVEL